MLAAALLGCCAVVEVFASSAGTSKIETFSYRSVSVVQTPRGELTALAQVYFRAPDRYREDSSMSFGKIVTVRRGDEAWAATPRWVSALTPAQRKRTAARLYRNYLGLMWAVADGRVEAEKTDEGDILLRVAGLELHASFEQETGRLLEISMPGSNLAGAPVTEKRVFADFDESSNLPSRVTVYHDEDRAAEITIKGWHINEPLAEDLFDRPEQDEKER